MRNERKMDFFVAKLLRAANIKFTPSGSDIHEIAMALRTASKKGTGHVGFPEFVAKVADFILVVEDKANQKNQALYTDKTNQSLVESTVAVSRFAENGALFYARKIIAKTSFKKVFAFGCSGDEEHHKIRPIFVCVDGYKLLPEVENFENFSRKNIERYYNEQVRGEAPKEELEIEKITEYSRALHEDLRNYGQLGESEKPLVVSAILLALGEDSFRIDSLTGDTVKTDGQKIFDALSDHMVRVEVQPETKKTQILNQFTIIKDRSLLSNVDARLGKTPLRYFAEFLKEKVHSSVFTETPEDILGRFYGEFIRYSGGDGQSLGVVLTPRHITELFGELVSLNQKDVLFDPCCGTGGFLIAGMHQMLAKAKGATRDKIKKDQIFGFEIREDMFSIATTNMILRGDGKSNLLCDDFLKRSADDLRKYKFTVGFMNPPYSQAKGKKTTHLSEINFIKHLLDVMADGGRCVVIVPQSTMVGKTHDDKVLKEEILKTHTLEGVITLSNETFYRVGTNPCVAVFTAHRPHPKEKHCKFIDFKDDGFKINKHVGLVETERAKERRVHLLSCWLMDSPAENSFMIKTPVEAGDEWLHSFYYLNDTPPSEESLEKTMADYLTFEFNMITHGRGYLFGLKETK